MSAEATGWVYRRSPYRGASFTVHLAVADSVNDQHGNEFWMAQGALASKARVGRQTANIALATMVADGYLEILEEGGGRSRPAHFRFLFPDVPVTHETRKLSSRRTVSKLSSTATESAETVVSVAETVVYGDRQRTQENPKEASKAFPPTEGTPKAKPAVATPQTPKAKPAPKPKAPPHPETSVLISYFVSLTDTPTLKGSTARVGQEIKKALGAGSAPAHIREALERLVKDGNPGAFVRLLNGVERHHRQHDKASRDSPVARLVIGMAAEEDAGRRHDDGGASVAEMMEQYGYVAGRLL